MKKRLATYGMSMALVWSGTTLAQVDLSTLDKQMTGPQTHILVLGSVHLSELPDTFKAESLEPILARLATFNPEIITVEQISGEGCDFMARHPTVIAPEDAAQYCLATDSARTATGLDIPSAIAEVNKALSSWPSQPTPAQRRHLVALFLAAGDSTSAMTQWLQLASTERHAGDGLDEALATLMDKRLGRNDESYQIAARLAARLGLQRVHPIDDHTGDNIAPMDVKAYVATLQQAWNSAAAKMRPLNKHEAELTRGGDMLALYRYINQPDVLRVRVDSDFGAALRTPSPQHYGQLYVAGWETRNLRMVANIRAAFRERPGARVLSIVGASHKPWFDSLLGQMQGVQIVDAQKVLQAPPQ